MKEIKEIISAFEKAKQENKKAALLTVVEVEGSSYRRPGARMLVTEDGEFTGAISGGCLEGDAMRKALLVMSEQQPRLITYDTDDEEDAKLGLQLGCNGVIHILIEPVNADSANPIQLLKLALVHHQPSVLVTLYSHKNKLHHQAATGMVLFQDKSTINHFQHSVLPEELLQDALSVLKRTMSASNDYLIGEEKLRAFIEYLSPATSMVIFGAGNDAIPLIQMSSVLGWETTVIDGRPLYATKERFPAATQIIIAKADAFLSQINVDAQTAFVLMTHNYNYDLAVLKQLIGKPSFYIGVLGPKKKLNRILDELSEAGFNPSPYLSKIYGPAGLDIGAENAEEIALSILSEIKAVLMVRRANFLRDKQGPIHYV